MELTESLVKEFQKMSANQEAIAQVLAGLQIGGKQPAGTPTVPPIYGQQGLFSYRADDVIINAAVNDVGISGWLNWFPSIYRNREQAIISQLSKDPDASNQTGPCSACPGTLGKGCEMSWCFGRICVESPEFQADELGVRPSVQYPVRRVYGEVPGQGAIPWERDDVVAAYLVGHGAAHHLAQMIWPGSPANNSALGGYMEFKGFDMLINVGYVDVETGATCTAADSDVKAFNRQLVCDSTNTNAWSIYAYMVQMYRTIQYRAMAGFGSRINPSDMLWVSAPEVIDGIIDCLACTYYPCLAGAGSAALSLDAGAAAAFRDRMVAEGVFHIDGVDIPYLKDPYVTKETGLRFGDETCADLFLLTRRHGPLELIFGEYQDMSVAPDDTLFGKRESTIFSMDGGRFLGTIEYLKWCTTMSILLKPRVIVLAPWLCGRLTDVCVRSPQHYPSPDPDSVYFPDGGHGTPLGKSLYDYCADEDLTPRQ
jgi:hypothetical protein